MPSSGYPIESIFNRFKDPELNKNDVLVAEECAKTALKEGLFAEWLESFVGAYIYLKRSTKPDVIECAYAGIEEWDM